MYDFILSFYSHEKLRLNFQIMKIEKKKAFSNLEKRRDLEKIKIKGNKINMVSNLDSYFSRINFFRGGNSNEFFRLQHL